MKSNKYYELMPLPDQGQKSFYGKAKVFFYGQHIEVLRSYDTDIMMKTPSGRFVWLYPLDAVDSLSLTTRKHIRAFSGLRTKDYGKGDQTWCPLETDEAVDWYYELFAHRQEEAV